MFLVRHYYYGVVNLVFTWRDPRADGYQGEVIEVEELDYNMEQVHAWPDGAKPPEACVGRKPDSETYKVFRYSSDRNREGYDPVEGIPLVVGSWFDYLKLRPDVREMDEEDYFQFLDDIDDAARERNRRPEPPDEPTSTQRDDVAAWVARKHLVTDPSIREVWYLPENAPEKDIRLLEVSERAPLNGESVDTLAYGLALDKARYRLVIADVTGEQLEQIQKYVGDLPEGWSLENAKHWKRRS